MAKGIIFAIENEFITGTTIDVDGGWLVQPSNKINWETQKLSLFL